MMIRTATTCLFLVLAAGCAWVEVGDTPDDSIDATVTSTEQAVEQFLTGRKLDPIEGAWVHDENSFEIIIARNTFDIADGYDYVGVITRSDQPEWHTGQVKLLLRKTGAANVFDGTWTARNRAKAQMTFVFENDNLIQASFRARDGNQYFVRIRRMAPRYAAAY
jgi:hypothetical protein